MKLYRFYNTRKEEYGRIFALCALHAETYDLPDFIILEKVARPAEGSYCGLCQDRKRGRKPKEG